jgi:putative Mn2+ efflux pump MntP
MLTVACFEGAMPLVGAALGAGLGRWLGAAAFWAAVVLLALLGGRALAEGLREWREEGQASEPEARPRVGPGGLGALLLAGMGVSLDEFAAGLGAGAAGLPLAVLAPALAVQAAVFTWAGLRAGAGLRAWVGRWGDFLAGVALLAVAATVALSGRH